MPIHKHPCQFTALWILDQVQNDGWFYKSLLMGEGTMLHILLWILDRVRDDVRSGGSRALHFYRSVHSHCFEGVTQHYAGSIYKQ